jgi:hypothetical protein
VSRYEKTYPGVTFVIEAHLGFGNGSAVAKHNDQLEARLSYFLPPPISVGPDCKVHNEYPEEVEKGFARMVDGYLYLGPQATQLEEPIPASIALDAEYMKEMQRRLTLVGFPADDLDPSRIVAVAAKPFTPTIDLEALKQKYAPLFQGMIEACLKK